MLDCQQCPGLKVAIWQISRRLYCKMALWKSVTDNGQTLTGNKHFTNQSHHSLSSRIDFLFRCNLKFLIVDVDKFLTDLKASLKVYYFIAKSQASYFATVEKNIKEGEFLVALDFSENYSFIIQDSVQSYHWNHDHTVKKIVIFQYIGDEIFQ